jgi:hypothetical protein
MFEQVPCQQLRTLYKGRFLRRLDLADHYKVRDLYWAQDLGTILRLSRDSWWCSNDVRLELLGKVPNADLVQPTLGPFKSFDEALVAYAEAHDKKCTTDKSELATIQ